MFVLLPRAVMSRRFTRQALCVPEILRIIFDYVADDSGKPLLRALAAIARTCRLFQSLAEEIIWYEIPGISVLYNILPPQVRTKEPWALNPRVFCGAQWARFMNRASRVRVLVENALTCQSQDERCTTVFVAMTALRDSVLLTPNLRKLEWQPIHPSLGPAINLFIGPSLRSLDIDVKLLISRAICVPLGRVSPRLEHLKITGNGRTVTGCISASLRSLHHLKTVACSSLDNDAFAHIAQLKNVSCLAVDLRWSLLSFDAMGDRLGPGSFHSLRTLYWKDYDLDALGDLFLLPDFSPSEFNFEIESFCTPPSLRAFLHSFTVKFPRTQAFSLVHDIEASKRFGLRASAPGREHRLDMGDLEPLLTLKSLRVLHLMDLGDLWLDDDLIKAIASAFPGLEKLHLGQDAGEARPASVTFDGLLSLLHHCPDLQSLGLSIDAGGMLSFSDTPVRQQRLTHLRLEGSILGVRWEEVDEMLRRVLPRLKTVEESLHGVIRRVREVGEVRGTVARLPAVGRRFGRRQTRHSSERAHYGGGG